MNTNDIQLVIFDLDGTLIDSNGANNDLDIKLARFLGSKESKRKILAKRDFILKYTSGADIYLNYCEFLKIENNSALTNVEILQTRREMAKSIARTIKYKKNAGEFLELLKRKNMKMALGTVSRRETLDLYMNDNEHMRNYPLLNYFESILTKDDVTMKKPDPEVYNRIVETIGVNPKNCVVIEDSLSGIKAAKKANLRVIAVYDKYSDKDRDEIIALADETVSGFGELIKMFI